jgi:surface antigen
LKNLDKLAIIYPLLFILAVAGIFLGYRSPVRAEEQLVNGGQAYSLVLPTAPIAQSVSANQVAVADVAAVVAGLSNLSVYSQATSNADTVRIKEELGQTDETAISKANEAVNSKAFVTYITLEGDNVDTIASKFNDMVSPTTIRWANGLKTADVTPGTSLLIPITDGVVYTVKEGDTVESIIEKYGSDTGSVAYYNDDIVDGVLPIGKQILLPNGSLPEKERPEYVAPAATTSRSASSAGWYMNGAMAGNRYAGGNCTWYAYNRRAEIGRPVGSFWGNAYTWRYAPAPWVVNSTPAAGAVFVMSGNHVGIVESVDWANGTMIISDMNNYGNTYGGYLAAGGFGFNRVSWLYNVPVSQPGWVYIH